VKREEKVMLKVEDGDGVDVVDDGGRRQYWSAAVVWQEVICGGVTVV
jgi:hypothetical protein